MTVEADIKTALNALVSGRVFPDVAPDVTPLPLITYQQIGGDAVSFMERAMPSMQNGFFKISIWGMTRAAVAALQIQVEAAMITSTAFQASAHGAPIADFDGETGQYGAHFSFSVWSTR